MKKIIPGTICAVVFVGFFAMNSYAQNEQLIITTYYPSPSGSYNELGADKLAVNVSGALDGSVVAVASEFTAMNVGDAHIGWSAIVGAGSGGVAANHEAFAYDELSGFGVPPGEGDLLVKGELGVGITIPHAKVEIRDPAVTQLRLTNVFDGVAANDRHVDFEVDANSDLTVTPEGTGQVILEPTTDSTDFFQVMDANGGTSMLTVDSTNERVGIGTDSPGSRLHVSHNVGGAPVWPPGTPPAANTVSLWVENTVNPSYAIYTTTPAGAGIYSNTGDGNALAGVNSSDTYNTIYAKNTGGSIAAVYALGTRAIETLGIVGGDQDWQVFSDVRLKRNIESMDSVIEKVVRLNPIKYEWKETAPGSKYSPGKHIGLVAQEVEEVFPELTGEVSRGYKSIKYGKLSAVLVKAIKEQQQQIEGLRKEIKALNSKIK